MNYIIYLTTVEAIEMILKLLDNDGWFLLIMTCVNISDYYKKIMANFRMNNIKYSYSQTKHIHRINENKQTLLFVRCYS